MEHKIERKSNKEQRRAEGTKGEQQRVTNSMGDQWRSRESNMKTIK